MRCLITLIIQETECISTLSGSSNEAETQSRCTSLKVLGLILRSQCNKEKETFHRDKAIGRLFHLFTACVQQISAIHIRSVKFLKARVSTRKRIRTSPISHYPCPRIKVATTTAISSSTTNETSSLIIRALVGVVYSLYSLPLRQRIPLFRPIYLCMSWKWPLVLDFVASQECSGILMF